MFHCVYQPMEIWTDKLSLLPSSVQSLKVGIINFLDKIYVNIEHHIHNQKNGYQCLLGQGNVQDQNTG
jgi:hypothetical protein